MSDGAVALYDIYGDPMAVEADTAIPTGTAMLVGGGSDGTNARYIKVDSSGNQIMIGLGTAGSPAGGVLTIQGDPSGTPAPISGTVTANAGSGNFSVVQATAALLNATVIGTVTANIGTSGALALDATLAKLTITPSTAIGSNTLAMVGGHVTTSSPTYTNGNINPLSLTTAGALRIDGSAVTQPVSGTVTANQGGAPWSSNITQFGGVAISTGTGASGTGIPRVTVANDSNILATQSGTWTVQQGTPPWSIVGAAADGAAVSGNPVRIGGSDGTNTQDILTDTTGRQVIVGAAASGAAVAGNPVLISGSDGTNARTVRTETDGTVRTKEIRSSSVSATSVAASASSVTLLASNANRIGATIYNDSNQFLYVQLGGTASTTSFIVKMNKDDYYEIPFNYTGVINGIWSSASGSARIVELT